MDGHLLLGHKSGIARYVKSLYLHLDLLSEPTDEIKLAFNRVFKPFPRKQLEEELETESFINWRYPYHAIRRLLSPNPMYELPYDLFVKPYDLFHGTNYVHYPIKRRRSIVTIHDMAWLKFPETTSEVIYQHHRKWVPYSAQQADRIIADSHHTKQDIIELLQVPAAKIDVIHLAADRRFVPLPDEPVQNAKHKYRLPEQYILFVGTLEPRKNLPNLIKAYRELRRNSDCAAKLVVVGAKGWKFNPVFELIQELDLVDEVIFTGFIDDLDLPAVYNGAAVFALPSLYEGFGIPVLEAMQCGVPVIASDVSSIPEIVQNAGFLLPPTDIAGWAGALHELLTNEATRVTYKELALDRAQSFKWEITAAKTLETYKKALTN